MAVLPACSVGAPHKRERLWYVANKLANPNANGRVQSVQPLPGELPEWVGSDSVNSGCGSMANPIDAGPQGRLCGRSDTQRENIDGHPRRDGPIGAMANTQSQGGRRGESLEESGHKELGGSDQVQLNAWGDSIGWPCRDGKTRPVPTEPTLFPLADGVSNRVGILRGAGNAIVPQVAAEVIKAFMEFEVDE
jgi:DNA (cytosine-5)-methyltransferase 1